MGTPRLTEEGGGPSETEETRDWRHSIAGCQCRCNWILGGCQGGAGEKGVGCPPSALSCKSALDGLWA